MKRQPTWAILGVLLADLAFEEVFKYDGTTHGYWYAARATRRTTHNTRYVESTLEEHSVQGARTRREYIENTYESASPRKGPPF